MSMRPSKLFEPRELPTVAVVGGGFAGLGACRHLRKKFNVVLIDAKEYFEYYPGILRAYLHPSEHGKLTALYQPACDGLEVRFVWGEVTLIDPGCKQIRVKCMARDQGKESIMQYDYCIICSGSQYGLYMQSVQCSSAPAECLWYPTFLEKTMQTCTRWEGLNERFISGRRAHFEMELKVLQELEKKRSTIVIVGAGFIGIEWATEVKWYLPGIEVVVVEARSECVSVMPPKCRKYCQRYMEKAGIKTIYNYDYKTLKASGDDRSGNVKELEKHGIKDVARVYMAVGVRSLNQFLPAECLDKMTYDEGSGDVTRGGWIITNKSMQVLFKGEEPWGNGCVFAAGNCCSVQGLPCPKNSFPGEDMASVACHNIAVLEKRKNPKFATGCFSFCAPKKLKELRWNWGFGLCATSLGPYDATFVAGSTEKPGSGYTVLTGCLAAYQKEFIRWSKVDECRNGWAGWAVWHLVH